MNFFAIIFRILLGLVPPSVWRMMRGARLSQKPVVHDRRSIDMDLFIWEVLMSAISLTSLAFGLISMGVVPSVGTGFAYASEQKEAEHQVLATRLEQLEWRMFDLRVKQCEAIKKSESPQAFTVQLVQQLATYRKISNKEPKLPQCDEL